MKIYQATVTSPLLPQGVVTMNVAATHTGDAVKKVQRECADEHLLRPYRGNSDIRLRGVDLHKASAGALCEALQRAERRGDLSTVRVLIDLHKATQGDAEHQFRTALVDKSLSKAEAERKIREAFAAL